MLFLLLVFSSCTSNKITEGTIVASAFAKGADVGWLPQMEATGYQFYDADGTKKDCLQLLKDRDEQILIDRY
jgi:arabinogalactan endo-1,4-beta-galactosidase